MAPPIYFFARKTRADVVDVQGNRLRPELLKACGLEETFADVKLEATATNEIIARGPGGASGVICTAYAGGGDVPKRTGFHPDFQTWRHCSGDLWIGVDNEHPPASEDLLRSTAVRRQDGSVRAPHPGYWMTLAAGGRWEVPVVRRPPICAQYGHRITGLPMDLGWDENGRFVETVKPAYEQLWEDCGAICDFFYDSEHGKREGDFHIGRELALKWALRILQLNYRYGRHEHMLLHAVDGTNVFPLLGMAIDAPKVNELIAKKNSASSDTAQQSTTPGSTDD